MVVVSNQTCGDGHRPNRRAIKDGDDSSSSGLNGLRNGLSRLGNSLNGLRNSLSGLENNLSSGNSISSLNLTRDEHGQGLALDHSGTGGDGVVDRNTGCQNNDSIATSSVLAVSGSLCGGDGGRNDFSHVSEVRCGRQVSSNGSGRREARDGDNL